MIKRKNLNKFMLSLENLNNLLTEAFEEEKGNDLRYEYFDYCEKDFVKFWNICLSEKDKEKLLNYYYSS